MVIGVKIILATALLGWAAWYLEPAELLAAAGQVGRDKVLICGAIALVGHRRAMDEVAAIVARPNP